MFKLKLKKKRTLSSNSRSFQTWNARIVNATNANDNKNPAAVFAASEVPPSGVTFSKSLRTALLLHTSVEQHSLQVFILVSFASTWHSAVVALLHSKLVLIEQLYVLARTLVLF